MADTTTIGIDRFFDAIDATIDTAARVVFGARASEPKAKPITRKARDERAIVDAPARSAAPRPYRIIEATDAQTGEAIFVVTDGVSRSECSSREMANKVKRALETP